MASAYDVANGSPINVMSQSDFNSAHGFTNNMYGVHDLDTLVNGSRDKAKQEYETYLNNVNNMNEWRATQSARAWDKMMSDTQFQRMVKDLKAAGLNPWLALQSGGVSGSSVPTSSKASYEAKNSASNKKSESSRNVALLMVAAARLIAAL